MFGTIFIPSIVYEELQHSAAPRTVRAALKPPPAWLKIILTSVTDVETCLLSLDEGEWAVLALGLRLGADLILMDERKSAAAARRMEFSFTETLGILILAAERQWLDLADAFSRLRHTNFHCSEDLLQSLLSRHGKN